MLDKKSSGWLADKKCHQIELLMLGKLRKYKVNRWQNTKNGDVFVIPSHQPGSGGK